MKTSCRAYLTLLLFNTAAVLLAALTAALLPAPRGWPAWTPLAWWLSGGVLSLAVLLWRWWLGRASGEEEDAEKQVAALSMAALPLLWGLFSVLAFWLGYASTGWEFVLLALTFAVAGYLLQPA
jgi:hypothetical protein